MDVKTAGRTLDLFEAFADEARPLRLNEIAAALDAPASSCFQLVRTLGNRGYLYAPQQKTYYPTRRMLHNAERISARDPYLAVVEPAMEELRDATGESVLVAQLAGTQALILEVLESAQPIRYSAPAGALRSLHCSGVGKCLLGELDETERDEHLPKAPYPRRTDATFTSRRELWRELAASRARGWYVSHGETSPDLWALAAPVRVAGNTLALCVAGPTSRMAAHEAKHVKTLLKIARKLQAPLRAQP